jgi:enoyl-CoA hydratase/carnithine racemase
LAKRATAMVSREQIMAHLEKVERLYLDELMKLSDAHEGIAAFTEKRAPNWRHA